MGVSSGRLTRDSVKSAVLERLYATRAGRALFPELKDALRVAIALVPPLPPVPPGPPRPPPVDGRPKENPTVLLGSGVKLFGEFPTLSATRAETLV